jgi:hypothetical protein
MTQTNAELSADHLKKFEELLMAERACFASREADLQRELELLKNPIYQGALESVVRGNLNDKVDQLQTQLTQAQDQIVVLREAIKKFEKYAAHKTGGLDRIAFLRYLANRDKIKSADTEVWNTIADALETLYTLIEGTK